MKSAPDSWILREPEDNDFDCECSDYHEHCEDDDCECIGHNEPCYGCGRREDCRCDYGHDSWMEDRRG